MFLLPLLPIPRGFVRLRALLHALTRWRVRPAPARPAPPIVAAAVPPLPGVDVLLVDDDAAIRGAFSESLGDDGYSVATADDGAAALQYLQTHAAPRLILLDLMMPVMNGWQFLEQQRTNPALRTIPVVVLTAAELSDHEKNQLQVDWCVRKPIDLRRLLTIADGYCRPECAALPCLDTQRNAA